MSKTLIINEPAGDWALKDAETNDGNYAADQPNFHVPRRATLPQPTTTVREDITDAGSVEQVDDLQLAEDLSRQDARTVSRIIARDPRMVLGILSFIREHQPVAVDGLIEYGNRVRLFEIVFDLYDAGLVDRSGAEVSTTPRGLSVLAKAGLC